MRKLVPFLSFDSVQYVKESHLLVQVLKLSTYATDERVKEGISLLKQKDIQVYSVLVQTDWDASVALKILPRVYLVTDTFYVLKDCPVVKHKSFKITITSSNFYTKVVGEQNEELYKL